MLPEFGNYDLHGRNVRVNTTVTFYYFVVQSRGDGELTWVFLPLSESFTITGYSSEDHIH